MGRVRVTAGVGSYRYQSSRISSIYHYPKGHREIVKLSGHDGRLNLRMGGDQRSWPCRQARHSALTPLTKIRTCIADTVGRTSSSAVLPQLGIVVDNVKHRKTP